MIAPKWLNDYQKTDEYARVPQARDWQDTYASFFQGAAVQRPSREREAALEAYLCGDSEGINPYLRNKGDISTRPTKTTLYRILLDRPEFSKDPEVNKTYPAELEEIKNHLDSLFLTHGQLAPKDLTVYRGLDRDAVIKSGGKLESNIGKVLTDKGYTSTTISPVRASAYSDTNIFGGRRKKPLLLRITVPKGSKILVPEKVVTTSDGHEDLYHRINEILLPRNGRYKVEKVTREMNPVDSPEPSIDDPIMHLMYQGSK